MKLANGLIRPDSGTIRVFGEDVTHMRETDLFKLRARIGMVFQESALFDSLSVEDNVAYRLHEEQRSGRRGARASRRGAPVRRTRAHHREVSLRALRRHAPPRLHRPRHHRQARPHPLRLAHRRPRSHHLNHHHRPRHQAARRHPHHIAADHPPPAGRLPAGHDTASTSRPARSNRSPTDGIDDSTKFLVLNEGRVVFDGTTHELVHTNDPWLKEYLS